MKRRANLVAFTNSYHGLTAGSLALTANSFYRNESYINRANVAFLPYDGYFGHQVDTIDYIEKMLTAQASGVDHPAAVIVETVQAEGGVNVARERWLQQLAAICADRDILLIVDDIQVGCGRCGSFFSFECAGIRPDIVLLSKAISGFGLPMSLVLLRPELDQWNPGEHSGTFRGNNLAFVTATATLDYWKNGSLTERIRQNSQILASGLDAIAKRHPAINATARGVGMIYGLEFQSRSDAQTRGSQGFRERSHHRAVRAAQQRAEVLAAAEHRGRTAASGPGYCGSLYRRHRAARHAAVRDQKRFPGLGRTNGAEGDRTLNLRIANAALSQLSYRPSR